MPTLHIALFPAATLVIARQVAGCQVIGHCPSSDHTPLKKNVLKWPRKWAQVFFFYATPFCHAGRPKSDAIAKSRRRKTPVKQRRRLSPLVHELSLVSSTSQWFRTTKNTDLSTGPLTCSFARSLAPLTHSLALPCSLRSCASLHTLICLLVLFAHSLACGTVND